MHRAAVEALTIMFCDMVGLSALSTRPPEQRDVVSALGLENIARYHLEQNGCNELVSVDPLIDRDINVGVNVN